MPTPHARDVRTMIAATLLASVVTTVPSAAAAADVPLLPLDTKEDRASLPTPPPSAQDDPLAARGMAMPKALADLVAGDVVVTALGEVGGLSGHLIESASGDHQVVYVTPDGEHLVSGLMFASGGGNVTNRQLRDMMDRFAQAAAEAGIDVPPPPAVDPVETDGPFRDWLEGRGGRVHDLGDRGGVRGVLASLGEEDGDDRMQVFYVAPDGEHAVAGVLFRGTLNVTGVQLAQWRQERARRDAAVEEGATDVSTGSRRPAPAPVEIVPGPTASVGGGDTDAAPWLVSGVDGSVFTERAKTAVRFRVGLPDTPVLYMVADPQCPFCHEAWRRLRPLVMDGELAVEVILIAGLTGSDAIARTILTRDDPGAAWLSGEGSTSKEVPTLLTAGSDDWTRAGGWLSVNARFAGAFGIDQTPFMAYVDGGDLYASKGLPGDLDGFLSALEERTPDATGR